MYYLHDKDSLTRERVEWSHTQNMVTTDPDKAVKIMAWTAMHQSDLKRRAKIKATGRKLQKPVFTFSVAWHPEQDPSPEHMLETAKSAVETLGLSEHQILYVAHNDEPQKHVHCIVNRVHPETGKAATLSNSKRKLSQWAYDYEKEFGKVYCLRREENEQKLQLGSRKKEKYCDPVIEQAWQRSDCGRSFAAALQDQGYHLAQGRKRIVVIDKYGKSHNPVRLLEGVKAKDFKARLKDLDLTKLPKADDMQKQILEENRKTYHESRKQDKWEAKVLNETQDRHHRERAQLFDKHHRIIEEQKRELNDYYKRDELAETIQQLERTLKNPSLWKRLTGKAAQNEQHLQDLKKQLNNIDERTTEKIEHLEKVRDQALEQQRNIHEEERKQAREQVQQRKLEPTQEEKMEHSLEELQEERQQKQSMRRPRRRGRGFGM